MDIIKIEEVENKIITIRDTQVILDIDVAAIKRCRNEGFEQIIKE